MRSSQIIKFLKQLKVSTPLVISVGFVLIIGFAAILSARHRSVDHQAVTVTNQTASSVVTAPSKRKPPSPFVAPTVPVIAKKTAAPKAKSSIAVAAPQPVVTAAPTSSVSSLVPVAPTTPNPSTPDSSPATTTGYESANWAGYLETGSVYSQISGAWTVPQATGNGSTTSADGTWIGIGGVTSGDLIQVGTDNTVSPNGHVTTTAFYELLPAISQTIPGVTVTAGDSITASIIETSPGQWTINLVDNTDNQAFTITVGYASSHSSAEWIEEDPSTSRNHLVPFDTFTPVTFTGAITTASGSTVNLNSGGALPVTLVNNQGQPLATPSSISSGGTSFTVTRNSP